MGILGGAPDFFGLDIGTSAVRVVQLRGKGPNKTVFRYGKMPLDQDLAEKTDVDSMAKLADTIRELLVQNQITTRNVVMGLPNNRVYSTIREFEALTPADLAKTLKFQIELIVPAHQESKVDWAILDADEKELEKREVFICSSRNDFIQQRLEMLESINLNVLAFEPDALALVRAMAGVNTEQATIIIDVGFNDSDIVIIHKNQPRLITAVNVGIFHIIKSVVNTFHVDQAQAQQLIFQVGFMDNQKYQKLKASILQSLDILMIQIRKSIGFFINRYPQDALSQIILCGNVAYIPGFTEFLSSQTNLPVIIGDSWQNAVCPEETHNDLKTLSVDFAVVAGLAERQVI